MKLAITMLISGLAVTSAADPVPPAPTAPPAAATPEAPPADPGSQMVCRSTVETGSLIAHHKVCLTRRQWVTLNSQTQDEARRMLENNPGGFRPQ